MKLNAIQEQEMIERFDRVVWRIVHRFMNRAQLGRTCTKDDLYQEGVIILLNHIRKAKDEAELRKLPVMDMWNAMSRLVLGDQPVKYPSTRTSDFRKIMSQLSETIEYSELENVDIHDRDIEEAEALTDMKIFADTLNALDRSIVLLRMKGMSRVEVSKYLHIPNAKTTRRLKEIKIKYLSFIAA